MIGWGENNWTGERGLSAGGFGGYVRWCEVCGDEGLQCPACAEDVGGRVGRLTVRWRRREYCVCGVDGAHWLYARRTVERRRQEHDVRRCTMVSHVAVWCFCFGQSYGRLCAELNAQCVSQDMLFRITAI